MDINTLYFEQTTSEGLRKYATRCGNSSTRSVVYLLFVGRTRQMTQDTASGMHQAAGRCTLMRDEMQRRKAAFDDIPTCVG
jgi:hypothetical protein